MKRSTLIGALIVSLAAGTTAMADGRGHDNRGHDDHGNRGHEVRGWDGRHDERGGRDYRGGHDYRGDYRGRDYRPGPSLRFEFRAPERYVAPYRWNDGYAYRPHEYYAPRYYAPHYYGHRWLRGERLPVEYYSSPYVIDDYGAYGFGAPPRGYRWVRVNGDAVLAAVATGIVLDAVFDAFH
jgi:Ni/Co efflux regulator RcnB